MSWNCRSEYASERVPECSKKFQGYGSLEETLAPIISGTKSFVSNLQSGQTEEELTVLRNTWFDLVTLYGKCGLTVKSDIFPAISGVARRIAIATGDTYYAGIWSNDIHRGLMWTAPDSTSKRHDLRQYRAPSWSWASVPATCNFTVRQLLQKNVDTSVLRVNCVQVDVVDGDEFGQVLDGVLNVEGLVKKAQVCPHAAPKDNAFANILTGTTEYTLFDLEKRIPVAYFFGDSEDKKSIPEVFCMPVWTEDSYIPSRTTRDARGLALRQLDPESNSFMRVGTIWIIDFDWYSELESQDLYIV